MRSEHQALKKLFYHSDEEEAESDQKQSITNVKKKKEETEKVNFVNIILLFCSIFNKVARYLSSLSTRYLSSQLHRYYLK